jgi:hypothetical protein
MSDTDLILIVLSTFVTLAYLSSSIIFIRFIITAQQIGFFLVSLYTGLDVPGMTAMFYLSIFNTTINSAKIIQYYYDNSTRCLPTEWISLYKKEFPLLTPKEFKIFRGLARLETRTGKLIERGHIFEELIYTLEGETIVRLPKGDSIPMSANSWLGEMSYINDTLTSADVWTKDNEEVKLLIWTKEALIKTEQKHPPIANKLHYVISANLCNKIEHANILLQRPLQ